jgi:hypothetical protein
MFASRCSSSAVDGLGRRLSGYSIFSCSRIRGCSLAYWKLENSSSELSIGCIPMCSLLCVRLICEIKGVRQHIYRA